MNMDSLNTETYQFPYELIQGDHCITIEFFENTSTGRTITPIPYSSIYELFHDLLYSEEWERHLSTSWRSTVFRAIEQIYFFENRTAFWLTHKERNMLYHQYLFQDKEASKILEFTVHYKKDRVAEDLSVLIKNKLKHRHDFTQKTLLFDSYENMLRAAEAAQINVPTKDFFSFPSGDSLASWVFQKIIDSEKEIKKCQWCGHYFVPPRADAQFCSLQCRECKNSIGKFCGIPEIQKAYSSIMAAFTRKKKSNQHYIYKSASDIYHGEYNDQELLSKVSMPKGDDTRSYKFSQKDFASMHVSFLNENQLRYEQFKRIHQSYQQGSISEADYESEKKTYVIWLENVRKQLTLFKRS